MQYRPEIDGLRAIAVLAVILFHVELLHGGYVGVDVFFVISGYLITGILLEDMQQSTFSFKAFYMRRARRILPALLFISICTIPFVLYALQAHEIKAFGQSLIAIALFVSNILFWRDVDYFALSNEYLPLLNTWSLAVEEQFYILYPLVLLLIWRYARQSLLLLLCAAVVMSLLATNLIANIDVDANFYLLPSRIWELMLGAILAYLATKYERRANPLLTQLLPLLGILCIAYSFYIFNLTTEHPGIITLIPTIGTCLILWFANPSSICTKILSIKALVGIGLISYSMYLWHYPIVVIWNKLNHGSLGITLQIVIIPLSTLLAYYSWRYIETPFRNRQTITDSIFIRKISILLVVTIGLGAAIYILYSAHNIPKMVENGFKRYNYADACADHKDSIVQIMGCNMGNYSNNKVDFVVTGDSHCIALGKIFNDYAMARDLHGIYAASGACAPLFGLTPNQRDAKRCIYQRDQLFEYVKQNQIRYVIMIAAWGKHYSTSPYTKAEFRQAYKDTLERYAAIGTKVILIAQLPMQTYTSSEIYEVIYAAPENQRAQILKRMSVKKSEHHRFQDKVNSILFNSQNNNVYFYDFAKEFCNSEVCLAGTLEQPYYADEDHPSKAGAEKLKPFVFEALDQVIHQEN